MNARTPRSVYARARRHMLAALIGAPVIIWGIPIILDGFGFSFEQISIVVFPLMMMWVLIGGGGSLLIACPKCGKSLFMRGIFAMPWPEKTCSRCGTDLTNTHR